LGIERAVVLKYPADRVEVHGAGRNASSGGDGLLELLDEGRGLDHEVLL